MRLEFTDPSTFQLQVPVANEETTQKATLQVTGVVSARQRPIPAASEQAQEEDLDQEQALEAGSRETGAGALPKRFYKSLGLVAISLNESQMSHSLRPSLVY